MLRRTLLLAVCIAAMATVGAFGSFNPDRDPSLVGFWKLDETSGLRAADSSGNENHGALMGVTEDGWVPDGVFGGALQFPGSGSWVDCGNDSSLQLTDEFTVAAWAKLMPGNDAAYMGVVGKLRTGNYAGYSIVRHSSNVYRLWIGNGTTDLASSAVDSDEPVTDTEWHHVAAARRNGRSYLFVDGLEQSGSTDYALVESQNYFHIGKQYYDYDDRYFNGIIDDVRLYSQGLTAGQIEYVMVGGAVAGDPSPAKGETDVLLETLLSWSAGVDAQAHDVYFGTDFDPVNEATRGNPMGVLVSQGQTATSYTPPEPFEYGTTYYWRIDEVGGAPGNTIHKGPIFSFTTELFAYPIEGIVVATNMISAADDQGPENVVNGSGLNENGQHSTDTTQMWLATPSGDEPMYIQFDFGRIYKMYAMDVWNHNFIFEVALGLGIRNVTVEYSADGAHWIVLGDVEFAQAPGTAAYTANTTVDFEGVAAQFARFIIHDNYGTGSQFGLSEVRFYYSPVHPRYPDPADGAVAVDLDVTLGWRAGRNAVSHVVRLSTDPNFAIRGGDGPGMSVTGSAEGTTFAPGILDLDTLYYWQVDASDGTGTWSSDVWTFSTREYTLIDGFETYTDDFEAGEAIWQTWIDGLEDATNGGSMVGNDPSPFAEQTLIHSGGQSMPLYYDNAGAGAISEADLALTPAQDWTASGIQSLSLWFRGNAGNTGRLYVKINGTKVSYDGASGDMATQQWWVWNIDLATVGTNLSNVTALSVGVEGTGSGVVYVDDIRLYAKTPEYITPVEPDAANLVAYYALEGNGNDSSGNGYHGTAVGGIQYVTGAEGQGIDLNGVDGYVDIPNTEDWPSGTEPRTMSAWGKPDSVDGGFGWMVAYGTAGTGTAMFLGIEGTTLYGGGYGDDVTSPDFWVVGEWAHTCLTYDGTTARLYTNGAEIASAPKNWGLTLGRAHIGQQVNDLAEFWDGVVDEVRIYSVALTRQEVLNLSGRTAPLHTPF